MLKSPILCGVAAAFALTSLAIAACPCPDYGTCPASGEFFDNGWTTSWVCCDQTSVCPKDHTKWGRFVRIQHKKLVRRGDDEWVTCVFGGYTDARDILSCCQ